MLTETLVALACLISHKSPVVRAQLELQMSESDRTQIQPIIDSDACLPENLEKLIKDTHNKIQKGEVEDPSDGGGHEPTFGAHR